MFYSINLHNNIVKIMRQILSQKIKVVNGLEIRLSGSSGNRCVMVVRMNSEDKIYISLFTEKKERFKAGAPVVYTGSVKPKTAMVRRLFAGGYIKHPEHEDICSSSINRFEEFIGRKFE